MKKATWDYSKDKMLVKTGHATFTRQTNVISAGNIIANTMLGWHCRPHSEVINPVGDECPPGHLRDFDLRIWKRRNIPRTVLRRIKELTQTESAWIYEFFHYNYQKWPRDPKRIVHGYVITSYNHIILSIITTGPTYKSENIVRECAKYVGDVEA